MGSTISGRQGAGPGAHVGAGGQHGGDEVDHRQSPQPEIGGALQIERRAVAVHERNSARHQSQEQHEDLAYVSLRQDYASQKGIG